MKNYHQYHHTQCHQQKRAKYEGALSLSSLGSRVGHATHTAIIITIENAVLPRRIPEDCVFFEPPLIARWEFNEKVWKTSDLEEMAYDEGKYWVIQI